ncbi:MAG TPA: DNA polymerase III subunit beta [Pseudonocardiaceae bacterium]|jgi:DNA polymerase-3 subunit beta|nr:DNA polymerase III subunit beta [Pseudonocardiaceae bacterium]
MDLTAATADLTGAAADVARLLPARAPDPVLSGVLLVADAGGVTVSGTDRERTAALHRPAMVHTPGTVLVPGRPLAETLRALDVPEVRLVVEGSRLAVRTPRGRFALPIMDVDLHPGAPAVPALTGRAAGRPLLRAFVAVAGAASRDDALPLFSGVRVRAIGGSLRLAATDRYRLAIAELPWRPAGDGLDVLIPATLATEIARQAAGAAELALHANTDRAAVAWGDSVVGTALLATPFPDEERYLGTTGDARVVVAADALYGAVRRVGLYADGRGAIGLELGDGEVRVRGGGADVGEADESVKATVTGQLRQAYQVRYLVDGLRTFVGQRINVDIKTGLRSTVLTAAEPDPDGLVLHYVVMPMLPA